VFLEDASVKGRLPLSLQTLLKSRNELNERMWHQDCPQASLRRLDAMLYCEWLSEQEGILENDRCYADIWEFVKNASEINWKPSADELKFGYRPRDDILARHGYRLPTEAELEYALRGGSVQARHFGDSDVLVDAYCWYRGNSAGKSQPVAMKKPNEFGFFDLPGNVSQHCQDLFLPYQTPLASSFRQDNWTTSNATGQYVMRGGDFESPPRDVRSAKRLSVPYGNNRFTQGFRVSRTEP